MAAKPTQDPKWVTSDDPNEIIEPSPALKTNGVQSGGIWGREHLNWMFNSLSKWIDWVRSSAMDKDNNLNDVADKPLAFNNIKQNATTTSTGVVEKATDAETESGTSGKFPDASSIVSKFLKKSDNLSSVANRITSFDNIKQTATTSYTGVVEKATSSEMISGAADKFPDASTIRSYYGEYYRQEIDYTAIAVNNGILVSGQIEIVRQGNLVSLLGFLGHTTASSLSLAAGTLPSWARPTNPQQQARNLYTFEVYTGPTRTVTKQITVFGDGAISFIYPVVPAANTTTLPNIYEDLTFTGNFSITYLV